MQVAIASCRMMPEGYADHALLIAELAALGVEAEEVAWDEPGVDWSVPELIAVRSTWDYTFRRKDFVDWTRSIGERLHNSASLIEWNSDKSYMADLAEDGVPAVPSEFLAPGEDWEPSGAEVVVKPTISAGARDTGRFGPSHLDRASELVRAIHDSGRTAMVQPFVESVDADGEAALAFIDGGFSHALHKRAVLAPDEVAPLSDEGPKAAKAMYVPDLVTPATADPDQLDLAERAIAAVTERFGYRPLYGRVDMLRDEAGTPILLELEMVEPNLYLGASPGAAARLARAIAARR